MIDDHDDNYQAVPRGSNLPKRPLHALTLRASQFRDTLYDWRTEMATGLFGALDFWPADLFLHEETLEDIVTLVNTNKIVTLQDLQKKTNWFLCNQYGDQIISLIQRFFPPAPLSIPLSRRPSPYECTKGALPLSQMSRTPHLICCRHQVLFYARRELPRLVLCAFGRVTEVRLPVCPFFSPPPTKY